ncbi:hypothetical protein [Clostridium sp.]|uniref:hypothetical protein n=1 Tax=Clostridium sp. TaxID=1506 RepID=UPI002615B229|nr:hypothetical protein [Clostridium sp.]
MQVDLEIIESRLYENGKMILGTNFYCTDEERESLLSFWNNLNLLNEKKYPVDNIKMINNKPG